MVAVPATLTAEIHMRPTLRRYVQPLDHQELARHRGASTYVDECVELQNTTAPDY